MQAFHIATEMSLLRAISFPATNWKGETYDFQLPYHESSLGRKRWKSLMGEHDVFDCWEESVTKERFQFSRTAFIKLAERRLPENNEYNNVSSFADWIYSIYRKRENEPSLRELGVKMERVIFDRRPSVMQRTDFCTPPARDWEIIHNGLHMDGETISSNSFKIPALSVNNRPMGACPDLILANKKTNQAIIVEIKFSRSYVPSNLWPNLWGQLWAYSKIPMLEGFDEVIIAGEVWGNNQPERFHKMSQYDPIYLRAVARKNPKEHRFDLFFRMLFDIYRRHHEHQSSTSL